MAIMMTIGNINSGSVSFRQFTIVVLRKGSIPERSRGIIMHRAEEIELLSHDVDKASNAKRV
jgi:hypothetical protein